MAAAITILDRNNVPQGPFTRTEVAERLHAGEFTIDSLAFVEGLTAWTPLREVLARVDAAAITPPPMPATTASVGPMVGASPLGPVAAAPYSYAASMSPPAHLAWAGFWLRFAAFLVDRLVLLPLSVLGFFIGFGRGLSLHSANHSAFDLAYYIFIPLSVVASWLYFAAMESSSWQATLGKKALGIYVTDVEGRRLTFGRATGRFFAKIISGLTCYIGYMMAGFTERKQALHDLIAATYVVRR
jgi:uncharacterized RDD family membrane protein YckC